MTIKYFYKNVESLNEELKGYIEKKLVSVEKLVGVREIKIEVSERRNSFFMSVVVFAKDGDEFRAENDGSSFQECIDIIEDELKNQIRRHKGKVKDLEKRSGMSLKKKMVIDENARF